MIEKILIFMLFLFPLIFFHELGHFFFARLFGVRVLTFSIGFGPKIFRFKKGETEYALSLIPLGGYVKMFGENLGERESIKPQDRQYTFSHKGKWARFWIIFGGPLFNFLMTFFLYFFISAVGEKTLEFKLGYFNSQSPFYSLGIRPGDVIKKINDQVVYERTDLPSGDETVTSVTYQRKNQKEERVIVNLKAQEFQKIIMSIPMSFNYPVVTNSAQEFFWVSDAPEIDFQSTFEGLVESETLYLYPITNYRQVQKVESYVLAREKVKTFPGGVTFWKELYDQGYYPLSLQVKSIVMDSPADKLGLQGGDVITALGEEPVYNILNFRRKLQDLGSTKKPLLLTYWRAGEQYQKEFTPQEIAQEEQTYYSLGVYNEGKYFLPPIVKHPGLGLVASLKRGVFKTWEGIKKTFLGLKQLMTREVSSKNLGGPIAIGKIAANSFHISLTYFLKIMALISINLGLINLFPIPVLDGGHILFIFLEICNGGPLSRKKLEIAQYIGFSLLLLLLFFSLYNDIMGLL